MITIDIRKSVKCTGEYSMFVSFPFDNKVVSLIRNLPSRYWYSDTKEWEVPVKKLEYLVDNLQDYEIKIITDYPEIFESTKPKALVNFEFKTKPFEHQIDGFNFGLEHDRWLLGDEQGLGKTKQVIDIAIAKKEQFGYKHCLIICGVNGLKWNWQNEIKIHSNESGYILGQRLKKGKLVIGSNKDKIADLMSLDSIMDYFIITNVESLRDNEIVANLSVLTKDGTISMIAFDEMHKAKNPSSQQGKGILKLSADTMIAMTGTPLMNTPMDLYIILKWLGYERHPFYAFKKHYCIMGGYGGYEVVGYKNIDELEESVKDIMLRRKKSDVLDLPDKLYIDEFVDMSTKQAQVYKDVTADIKAHIDEIAISPNPLAQLIRLRQATGYTGILSSEIKESAKLDRMEEIIDDAIANGNKVVIFSNWTQMTEEIVNRISPKCDYAIITGETSDSSRQTMVNDFQNNSDCKVIIGTIGAMGTGLTLTAGTVEIFMDEPWNKALKDQAEDRCHRIGATENVTIYTIMCKNTIDERIHELIEKKGAMSDLIIDGEVTGNKTELLNFLLS